MKSRCVFVLSCCVLVASATFGADEPPVPRVGNPHGEMDLDCRLCHTADSWEVTDGGFDHDSTGFPLEGRHREARCRDCHEEPVFAHIGTHCNDCHDDIHRGRLGPNCSECHSPDAWVDPTRMRRDHAGTSMPLVGAHALVDCAACHDGAASGDYVGTPTACYGCHRSDYEATDEPDHLTVGFGTECEQCHGVFASTWGSGDFIHPQSFPLTGAHRRIACATCHPDGFTSLPTDCYACHRTEYEATNDPNHATANFPTRCDDCHSTTAWEPADWNHDTTYFPIYSGRHREQWTDCAECHVVQTDYSVFECIFCHEHNRTDTDRDHVGEVSDYRYESTACLACHPDGRN